MTREEAENRDDPILNPNVKDIPEACHHCSNHPSNGGSGICHCTLGSPTII